MGIFKGTAQKRRTDVVSHPADAIVLQAMAGRGELGREARFVHHLFFRDQETAMDAAERAEAQGWSIDWLDAQPEPFVGWDRRRAGRGRPRLLRAGRLRHPRQVRRLGRAPAEALATPGGRNRHGVTSDTHATAA